GAAGAGGAAEVVAIHGAAAVRAAADEKAHAQDQESFHHRSRESRSRGAARASAVFALGRRRTQVRSRLRQLPEDPTTSPQGAPRRLAQAACAGGLQGSAATAAVTASLPQRPGELGEDVGAREDVVRGDAALPRRTLGEPAGVEEEERLGRVTES